MYSGCLALARFRISRFFPELTFDHHLSTFRLTKAVGEGCSFEVLKFSIRSGLDAFPGDVLVSLPNHTSVQWRELDVVDYEAL